MSKYSLVLSFIKDNAQLLLDKKDDPEVIELLSLIVVMNSQQDTIVELCSKISRKYLVDFLVNTIDLETSDGFYC